MVHSYPGDLAKAVAHLPGQQLVIGHAWIVGPLTLRDHPGVDERAVPPD
jgi:hypothetical protein